MIRFLTYSFIIGLGFQTPGIAKARGQDELTPKIDTEDASTNEDKKNPQTQNSPSIDKNQTKTPPKEKQPKSELSKHLHERLYLSSGMGYSSVSGDSGDWTAGINGDFGIGYVLTKNILTSNKWVLTFRYIPTDVSIQDNEQSYQGVVEIYSFGAMWRKKMKNFELNSTFELGLIDTSLKSTDGDLIDKESLEEGTVNLTVGGGMDWEITEKIKGGPRVSVGFGTLTYIQVAGSLSFFF